MGVAKGICVSCDYKCIQDNGHKAHLFLACSVHDLKMDST